MKYFIIDNFIDKKLCSKLIKVCDANILSKNINKIHGGRQFLSSTSLEFNNLIENSKDWRDLEHRINSFEFLNFCLKKLDLTENNYSLVNFFKSRKLSFFQKLYKKYNSKNIGSISTKNLLIYSLMRFYRDILRKIKFSKIFCINKSVVELLFDYSKAGNGYSRKIHRDSDSRLIVFLIYLNSPTLTDSYEGGDLDIYRLINGEKDTAFPDKKDCEKIESIKPEAGKLVVFLNNNESFHGVEEMKNHSDYRHFIYGGFTLLNSKNPFITNNKVSVDTEFHLYE